MTTSVCIKKACLQKRGYSDFEDWNKDPNHVYVGRQSVYVKGTYKSKWHNPYTVKKYGRDECLSLYKDYISTNKQLMDDITELKGKELGCWCDVPKEKCHSGVLIEILNSIQK